MTAFTAITPRTLPRRDFALSTREVSVLQLMTDGLADKEIAERLEITPFTVNKHVGQILLKMDCRSRTGAAVKAIRNGICG